MLAKSKPVEYNGATQKVKEKRTYSSIAYTTLLSRIGGGLEAKYKDQLYDGDVEHKLSNGEIYYCGTDLHLTINDSLQQKAVQYINDYPEASIVVMDDDGQIKAFASSKEMTMDSMSQNIESFHNGELINNNLECAPCGSVLKPIIAELMLENNKNLKITDKGYITVDGIKIKNAKGTSFGKIGMEEALVHSSNQYFVRAALDLGSSEVEAGFAQFGIGSSLNTDFGDVACYVQSPKSDYALARCAIGQDVSISPLQLAQVMQGIVTGNMAKPYIVKSVSKDGELKSCKVEKNKTKTSIDKDNRTKVCKMLEKCSISYKLSKTEDHVMAKTGTSQNGDGTQNAVIMASWTSDKRYYAVVRVRNTEMYGRNLVDIMKKTISATNKMND